MRSDKIHYTRPREFLRRRFFPEPGVSRLEAREVVGRNAQHVVFVLFTTPVPPTCVGQVDFDRVAPDFARFYGAD